MDCPARGHGPPEGKIREPDGAFVLAVDAEQRTALCSAHGLREPVAAVAAPSPDVVEGGRGLSVQHGAPPVLEPKAAHRRLRAPRLRPWLFAGRSGHLRG